MRERYDAAKVQLIRAVPFSHGGFREWFGRRTTGICHANIDPAKMVVSGVGELADTLVFSNVECRGIDLHSVQSLCLFGDLVQGLGVAGADGEIGAFGCKGKCRGTTNSFAGCCNNGDAISESGFHEVSININSVRVPYRRDLLPG